MELPDRKCHIGTLMYAYNCTKHDSKGFLLYLLMFGHHPRIAVDLVLGKDSNVMQMELQCYIPNLRTQLKEAYELAETNSKSSQGHQKRLYDRHVQVVFSETGDTVSYFTMLDKKAQTKLPTNGLIKSI